MKNDRTVHGHNATGDPIVRYDRAGKWYLEPEGGKRRRLSLHEAARMAALGTVRLGQPGGTMFDAAVRQALPRSER